MHLNSISESKSQIDLNLEHMDFYSFIFPREQKVRIVLAMDLKINYLKYLWFILLLGGISFLQKLLAQKLMYLIFTGLDRYHLW